VISESDLRNILRHKCEAVGSVTEFARRNAISQSFLNKMIRGETPVTAKVAKIAGYERKVVFTACKGTKDSA
jgi:DNA-binding transcriptional regulator YdaS (Cro superfamily)